MNVETDDMRLQFLKDFGVTDCAFTDTSAGLLQRLQHYSGKSMSRLRWRVKLVWKVMLHLHFPGLQMCQAFLSETLIIISRSPTLLWA